MDTKQNKATPSPSPLSVRDTDGLFLNGLVVAVEKLDRKWEDEEYKQLKATIVDGTNTFIYIVTDKKAPLPPVIAFTRVSVRVDWASKEKGIMTVRGDIIDE